MGVVMLAIMLGLATVQAGGGEPSQIDLIRNEERQRLIGAHAAAAVAWSDCAKQAAARYAKVREAALPTVVDSAMKWCEVHRGPYVHTLAALGEQTGAGAEAAADRYDRDVRGHAMAWALEVRSMQTQRR